MTPHQIESLIPIFGGIYSGLLAWRIIPLGNSRDPVRIAKVEAWHRQFGPMLKICCPLLVLFGLAEFFGAF